MATTRKKTRKYFDQARNISINVIIPVKNEDLELVKTIKNVLNQKGVKIKSIILVDDNSKKKSKTVYETIRREFGKKIFILGKRGRSGIGSSIKTGLKFIRHDLNAVVTADMTLRKDCFLRIIHEMEHNGSIVGSCLIAARPKNGISSWLSSEKIWRQIFFQKTRISNNLYPQLPGCLYIFKNPEVINRMIKDSFVEDFLLSMKLYQGKYRISILPEVLASEKMKKTFFGSLKQRIRWSLGDIGTLKTIYNFLKQDFSIKKLDCLSYSIFYNWIKFFTFLCLIFSPISLSFLVLFVILFTIQVISIAISVKGIGLAKILIGVFLSCMINFLANIIAILLLITRKSTFFEAPYLFEDRLKYLAQNL